MSSEPDLSSLRGRSVVVTGCTRVSPGCVRCYADTFLRRWDGVPGHHFTTGFAPTTP